MQNHWQNQGRQLVSVASCNPRLTVFVDSLCFGVGEKFVLFHLGIICFLLFCFFFCQLFEQPLGASNRRS